MEWKKGGDEDNRAKMLDKKRIHNSPNPRPVFRDFQRLITVIELRVEKPFSFGKGDTAGGKNKIPVSRLWMIINKRELIRDGSCPWQAAKEGRQEDDKKNTYLGDFVFHAR